MSKYLKLAMICLMLVIVSATLWIQVVIFVRERAASESLEIQGYENPIIALRSHSSRETCFVVLAWDKETHERVECRVFVTSYGVRTLFQPPRD